MNKINEWSQCSIWTAGSQVRIFLCFTKLASVGQRLSRFQKALLLV